MLNTSETSTLSAHSRAVKALTKHPTLHPRVATSRAMTTMMRHGGLYSLLDTQMMTARLTAVAETLPQMLQPHSTVSSFVASVSASAQSFFQHLVQKPYTIHSNLMSHIAFPHEGVAYTKKSEETNPAEAAKLESPELPAATTFIGQFIDHDLTMNAVDLFISQDGNVQNTASPLIDLDSVYGPRSLLNTAGSDLYEADGRTLRLQTVKTGDGNAYYDLVRDAATGEGTISDKRNDENQMILQVHLLLMRVHNKLAADYPALSADELRRETILTWQSVLVNDHLPNVLDGATLTFLLGEIVKPDFGDFFYKPLYDLHSKTYVTSLPHEFAIAFRYGHSQLKPGYIFRAGGQPFRLFDNTEVPAANGASTDLRGGQALPKDHVIDWNFFATTQFRGNRIDGKVTSVVFDLPESAIPDDIKFIGNLVHRNLIRSQQIGLCSGEDLADAYGIARLAPSDIEPHHDKRTLFEQDGAAFLTPLWYYILREAQHHGTPTTSKLGPLGSRLVGEVVLGAIHWGDVSYFTETNNGWKSRLLQKLNGSDSAEVKFLDLANYVGPQPAPIA
ncbi:peroxidase family protein [Terriglobus sp.]|uniref:peroxidase family protein n=1 Tax=Terriglobus sp. TaxID=1889013 RepID=UPI003B00FFD6